MLYSRYTVKRRLYFFWRNAMNDPWLTIGEFSRLSGIGRKTLIFYDRTGVFPPAFIGKNRYRRYSHRQLQIANVILALREINVPLEEIKTFLNVRSPGALIELCGRQERRIRAEMEKLRGIDEVIQSLSNATESARSARPGKIEFVDLPAERLFMGADIGSVDMGGINDALSAFYELCARLNVPWTHPLGSVTRLPGAAEKSLFNPIRFYCPVGKRADKSIVTMRPAGTYAVCHAYGDYGKLAPLYRKMLRSIKRQNLVCTTDAYEEYVLSEMALHDPDSYLARVMIRVKKKR